MGIESLIHVKLYGVVGSSHFFNMDLPPSQIEEGGTIAFQNRKYQVISKIKLEEEQYAVNVISHTY